MNIAAVWLDTDFIAVNMSNQGNFIMPRCTVHRRHTVVRSCVGSSVPRFLGFSVSRFLGPSDLVYLCER